MPSKETHNKRENKMADKGEILIYQSQQGTTKIDVRMQGETVWLSLNQISELFQKTKSTISEHIANIYEEGELDAETTVRKFRTVQQEGKRRVNRDTEFYDLDVIISVGYRVKSHIGTHFRKWATQRLKEYIVKGFVLDDERLKQARNNYFDELLARIRDIRSSEKVFYRKICDIYATSIDYDANIEPTQQFFAAVQNKFHWAIHAHTAAELIKLRADASKPFMGLTNYPSEQIKKQDVLVAKNYLNEKELNQLNRIVNQYLEFAELQALQHKPMHMKNWIEKLHGFLKLNDRNILKHAGSISHEEAEAYALKEFEKYQNQLKSSEPDELDKAVKKIKSGSRN
jgi:hypothetical protein